MNNKSNFFMQNFILILILCIKLLQMKIEKKFLKRVWPLKPLPEYASEPFYVKIPFNNSCNLIGLRKWKK